MFLRSLRRVCLTPDNEDRKHLQINQQTDRNKSSPQGTAVHILSDFSAFCPLSSSRSPLAGILGSYFVREPDALLPAGTPIHQTDPPPVDYREIFQPVCLPSSRGR